MNPSRRIWFGYRPVFLKSVRGEDVENYSMHKEARNRHSLGRPGVCSLGRSRRKGANIVHTLAHAIVFIASNLLSVELRGRNILAPFLLERPSEQTPGRPKL